MVAGTDVLEIHLFGGFAVSFAREPLPPLPSRHARSLFAHLVLHAGRPQSRSLLADRFWPEALEPRARRRLSHALWQLQDALGELAPGYPYLLTPGDGIVFDATAPYWLDVEEFEGRLDRVDSDALTGATALRELRRCMELYQGELLAGWYEPWALEEQARLGQRYLAALTRSIEECKRRGSFEEALTLARRLTHQEPLREDGHREVMRLSVLLGQPNQAMEQYERCRSVFLEELGTEPAALTTELYQRIARTRHVTGPRPAAAQELVSRRLVGRDDERVRMVDQVERTLSGTGSTVFVEGEPGVGKTQLLTQVAEDATWRGFRVLWGTCHDHLGPYGVIRNAMTAELDPVRVAQLRARLSPAVVKDAAQLLEPLRAASHVPHPPPSGPRAEHAQRMRDALIHVVAAMSALDPVLLVVEDAHRADFESMELLRALAKHDHEGRLLIVVTFRDLEAREDEALWAALRELDRSARPLRLELRPLSPFETARLIAEVLGVSEVPASFAGPIHRECGGNPLYVVELLRSLRDKGSLVDHDPEHLDALAIPVTDGLRSVIGGRLDHLDPSGRILLELGAVLGGEFAVTTLQAASELAEVELTTRLGELVRRNILDSDGQTCRFTHAVTRRVVVEGIDRTRSRQLHGLAGSALEATHPDRSEALASHFRHANLPQRALPHLHEAARQALAVHAYATAETHLTVALGILEHVPVELDEQMALLFDLEEVLDVLGERDRQSAVLDELEQLVIGQPEKRIQVALRRATHLGHLDRFTEAREAAKEAVAVAQQEAPALHGHALTVQGQILSWAGDSAQAVAVLEQAVGLLSRDPGTEAEAQFARGTALRFVQRFGDAREALERSLTLAEKLDDQRGVVRALGALADLHAEAVRTEEAVSTYERAITLARSLGYRHREGVSQVNLGTVRLVRAEPTLALAAYDRAGRIFDELANHRGAATVRLNRAWLWHRWLGDDHSAERDAEAAREYFHDAGNFGSVAVCLETLAAISQRRGDFSLAEEHLTAGLRAAQAGGEQRAEVQVRRGQVELALRRHDPTEANEVLDVAEALAADLELVEFAAELRSLRALALLLLDDHDAAWNVAQDALQQLVAGAERHRIHHRAAKAADAAGHVAAGEEHHRWAYLFLQTALADLDTDARDLATGRVPEHRAIIAAGRPVTPQDVTVRMAVNTAPRGRSLLRTDTVDLSLRLGPPANTPDGRAAQILEVLDQAHAQDAEPTLRDLADILDVSVSTVRRDLRRLRERGQDVSTRGSGTA